MKELQMEPRPWRQDDTLRRHRHHPRVFAMLAPVLTGIWVVMLVGVLVLVGGIVRIVWAFQAGSLGKGLLLSLSAG